MALARQQQPKAIYPVSTIMKPVNEPFTEKQLKGIFMKHDKNGDGRLSMKELREAFEELGAWFPGWKAWHGLRIADADKNGFISQDEIDSLVKYALKSRFTVN